MTNLIDLFKGFKLCISGCGAFIPYEGRNYCHTCLNELDDFARNNIEQAIEMREREEVKSG